ncbi:sigma factor, ECF-like family protein [Dyella monticola]|uniref:Sigma factor, ECF-like family protein n=2 Tax=Dyella monticola TaxID=1927958 RepID=A0A370X5R7_9GAMM|nr:sigma factor, ECF-like family protein [Dyella monticola]
MQSDPSITQMIAASRSGDDAAFASLFSAVYASLRQMARRRLSEVDGFSTLSTTALVHETYLKMLGSERPELMDRGHLMGITSHAMRQVLIDYARRQHAAKRPQRENRLAITEIDIAMEDPVDLESIDAALTKLADVDPQQAKVVEMKFFGGMTLEEIAQTLDISTATVTREWRMARAWLRRELGGT